MVSFSRLIVLLGTCVFSRSSRIGVYALDPFRKSHYRLFDTALFGSKSAKAHVDKTRIRPLSANQKEYARHLSNSSVSLVVAMGVAGTGKTMLACTEAVRQLREGTVQKIVLTRPLIAVEEEEIGFLPGSMVAKMDPWTRPMFDIFREVYSVHELNQMVRNGIIEIAPLAFMRGRTFDRSFVIADEMQNSSPGQMFMLTTRLGRDSKMVVTGDLQQSDRNRIYEGTQNGLADFVQKCLLWKSCSYGSQDKSIAIVSMTETDVFRSPFVSRILEIYGGQRKDNTESFMPLDFVQTVHNISSHLTLTLANNSGVMVQSPPERVRNVIVAQEDVTNIRFGNLSSRGDASLIPPRYLSKHYNASQRRF